MNAIFSFLQNMHGTFILLFFHKKKKDVKFKMAIKCGGPFVGSGLYVYDRYGACIIWFQIEFPFDSPTSAALYD